MKWNFKLLGKLTGSERVHLSRHLTEATLDGVRAGIRHCHPEWDDEEVRLAFIRWKIGDRLFEEVFGDSDRKRRSEDA